MTTQLSNPSKGKSMLTLGSNMRTYTMLLALIILWVFFEALTHGLFLVPRNLSNLFEQSAETAILAVGMTLVIVSAEIDLSVGSLTGLAGGIAAICQVWLHWNTLLAILAGLVIGLVLGLFQGWWVAYLRVPSFIVTLGGMLIFRGVLEGLTNGTDIAPMSNSFLDIGQAYLTNVVSLVIGAVVVIVFVASVVRRRRTRVKLGFEVSPVYMQIVTSGVVVLVIAAFIYVMNMYSGVPVPVFILIVIAGIFTFLASRTRFGRHLYAIGGNKEAAKMSGIAVRKKVLIVFALSGLLAGLAGVILTARLGAGTVDAGTNYELDAIAACVIGGSSLMGGTGSIFGSIIGALVMGSIDNGMSLMNAPSFWQDIVKGLILMVAVWIDMSSKSKRAV